MKAIRFNQYGEPAQVLAVQEHPAPEPGNEEVRVRILASPINPSGLLFVRGWYAGVQPRFPSPAGLEGVGLVDALGPHVQGLVHGQRVAVLNGEKGGNWTEYAVVPAHLCWLLGTSVWKTGEFLGEDQHCVKKSEWTVLNFSLSQAARKSDEERRQRFFLKSLFSERMIQVASTGPR